MINKVLDITRIETGELRLEAEEFSAKGLIDECLEAVQDLATELGIVVRDESAEMALPGLHVDRDRMRQALLNLLTNAVRYNRRGGEVALSAERMVGNRLRIMVTDNGIGIPENEQAKVFEPFAQINEGRNITPGTGIGLSITRRLVEMMDGDAGFESTKDLGSKFWLDMPAMAGPLPEPVVRKRPTRSPDGEIAILYVEDNEANLTLMESVVRHVPHSVLSTARTAEQGLELARDQRFDLVLLDINLPGLDGYAALSKLRAMDKGARIPIIGISGNSLQSNFKRARDAGFDAYLTKPVDVAALLAKIDEFMADRQPGSL